MVTVSLSDGTLTRRALLAGAGATVVGAALVAAAEAHGQANVESEPPRAS